jgi:pimeloyl-ACP methyl ester carboxylesterase
MRDIVLDTARGRFGALRNDNTDGVPLLALHGWLDNAASFLPMAPLLTGYDLVALDMPGHGRSFHYPDDAEYSLFSTILDLLAAADTLGWERFAVLGHSMGGAIASLLAAAAPERIERLFRCPLRKTAPPVVCATRSPSDARWTPSANACSPIPNWRCRRGCTPSSQHSTKPLHGC